MLQHSTAPRSLELSLATRAHVLFVRPAAATNDIEVHFLVKCGADGCAHEKLAVDSVTKDQIKAVLQAAS